MTFSVDTNVFIKLVENYPEDSFPDLLPEISGLISKGIFISPNEVLKEINQRQRKDDPVVLWAEENAAVFIDLDNDQIHASRRVQSHYEDFSVYDKPGPWADPLVIALALCRNATVLTTEIRDPKRPKISTICDRMDVPCMNLLEFFRTQGWKFYRK